MKPKLPSYADTCLERAEKATPGPWSTFFDDLRYCANDVQAKDSEGSSAILAQMNRAVFPKQWKDTAEFIAYSREMVPELCRRLKRACEYLKAIVSFGGENMIFRVDTHTTEQILKELEGYSDGDYLGIAEAIERDIRARGEGIGREEKKENES